MEGHSEPAFPVSELVKLLLYPNDSTKPPRDTLAAVLGHCAVLTLASQLEMHAGELIPTKVSCEDACGIPVQYV